MLFLKILKVNCSEIASTTAIQKVFLIFWNFMLPANKTSFREPGARQHHLSTHRSPNGIVNRRQRNRRLRW